MKLTLALENLDEPEVFKKMIKLSLGIHVALLFFFGVKTAFFPEHSLQLESAVKVDLVGLPDKLPPTAVLPPAAKPKEAPAEPAKKVAPPQPKTIALTPKSKKSQALDKIKRLEREEREKKVLDQIKDEVAEEDAKDRRTKINQLLKGNVVTQGSALHGLAKTEFNEYLETLHGHVQEHWNLPEWLQNDSLRATVIVHIDYRGVVLKRVLERSSGDTRFDGYAIKAVDDSSPFPAPPPKFVDLVRSEGIILGFPK